MELRACYFCGSPGGGLDTYPVVPERVAPDDAGDPERVVLCPDCHAKLERVLDGVFATLDAAPTVDGPVDPDPSPVDADGRSGEITFGDAAADATDDDRVDPDAAEGSAGAVEGVPDDDRDAGIDVVPEPSTGSGEGDESTTDATAGSEAVGDEGADAGGESDAGAGDDADTEADTDTGGGSDADTDAEADDDADGSAGASGTLRGLGNSGTGKYRQALRLLRNREFPMSRSDLVDVMSSAYDLSRTECDRLVDVAVDRGWLVDDDGVLRRD